MEKNNIIKARDEILLKALSYISFDGWTWDIVCKASEDVGCDKATLLLIFPDRMVDVLDGFSDMADRAMLEALEYKNPLEMRVRDRVSAGVIARFEWLQQYKNAVRQSLRFWIIPFRKPQISKSIWRSADHIWNWAGDNSKDYNHYTKRVLLSGVIISTTFAWLKDSSEDMGGTKIFLDRRIENVMQLGEILRRFKRVS